MVVIEGINGDKATVETTGGVSKLHVAATVTVEEIFGTDNYPDTWFRITNSGSIGDTIRVKIDQPAIVDVTTTLTANEVGDIDKAATLIAATLNADPTFASLFQAKTLFPFVFVTSRLPAEKGEYPIPGDFSVTVTGTTTYSMDSDNDRIIRRKKSTFLTPDAEDPRLGVLGIRGDVSSTIKANNPVHESIRKILASTTLTPFYDQTVPDKQVWYVPAIEIADDTSGEMDVWRGIQRSREIFFSGNGSNKNFLMLYAAIEHATYMRVWVGGVEKFINTDWNVTVSDDGHSATLIFKSAPPSGTNNIRIVYDAVKRVAGVFIQASSSYSHNFEAPLKLSAGEFVIVTVANKSNNSAVIIVNFNGFYESIL